MGMGDYSTNILSHRMEEVREEYPAPFQSTFSSRDAILFALSLGYGSCPDSYNEELRYVWEDHPEFCIVPTFAFAILFWAVPYNELRPPPSNNQRQLPEFPPPFMRRQGLVPPQCLVSEQAASSLDEYPVLHTWQCIQWHYPLTAKTATKATSARGGGKYEYGCGVQARFLSVIPKSIGTFVTTETSISELANASMPLCTIQSTTLIFGLDSELVKPIQKKKTMHDASPHQPQQKIPSDQQHSPHFEQKIHVGINQALLYRLASGDSNRIHVDPESLPPSLAMDDNDDGRSAKRPILHGLATLGMAARVIEQFACTKIGSPLLFDLVHLEARFTKPVFLGEELRVSCWWLSPPPLSPSFSLKNSEHVIVFRVTKIASDEISIDNGFAKVMINKAKL
mmetsp:Transcript_15654/g.20404  ORF Transcript_15654/g.20404 Transcript_15654/m.20404 type:complete len:396 (+) Transcript_15654:140-1327(+)